jgi:hypothetical protein
MVAMLSTGRYAAPVAAKRALRAAMLNRLKRDQREAPVESETLATLAEAAAADDRADDVEVSKQEHDIALSMLGSTHRAILRALVAYGRKQESRCTFDRNGTMVQANPYWSVWQGATYRLRLPSRVVADTLGLSGNLGRNEWEGVRRTAAAAYAHYSRAIGGWHTQDVTAATERAYNYVTTTSRMGTGAPLLARTKTQAKGRIHHRMGERTSIPVYPVTIRRADGSVEVVEPKRTSTRAGLQGQPFTAPNAGELAATGPTGAYGQIQGVSAYGVPVGAGMTQTLPTLQHLAQKGETRIPLEAEAVNRTERKDRAVYATKALCADAICGLYAESTTTTTETEQWVDGPREVQRTETIRTCACGWADGQRLVEVKRTNVTSGRALPSHWAHQGMTEHTHKH